MTKLDTTALGVAAAAAVTGGLAAWGALQGSMQHDAPLGLWMVVFSFIVGPLVLLVPIAMAIGAGLCSGCFAYAVARMLRYQPGGAQEENGEVAAAATTQSESGRPNETGSPMSEYGIRFDGAKYRFREFQYDKLEDAINYATQVRTRDGV